MIPSSLSRCRVAYTTIFLSLLLSLSVHAWALPITDQFTLSGLVKNPGALPDLQTFSPVT